MIGSEHTGLCGWSKGLMAGDDAENSAEKMEQAWNGTGTSGGSKLVSEKSNAPVYVMPGEDTPW